MIEKKKKRNRVKVKFLRSLIYEKKEKITIIIVVGTIIFRTEEERLELNIFYFYLFLHTFERKFSHVNLKNLSSLSIIRGEPEELLCG